MSGIVLRTNILKAAVVVCFSLAFGLVVDFYVDDSLFIGWDGVANRILVIAIFIVLVNFFMSVLYDISLKDNLFEAFCPFLIEKKKRRYRSYLLFIIAYSFYINGLISSLAIPLLIYSLYELYYFTIRVSE